MGLDVTAYKHAKVTLPHERTDECYEKEHVLAFCYGGFEQSLRGLEADRCYEVSGPQFAFRAGSYSGYGYWRDALCVAALEINTADFWTSRDAYRELPFFEILNFADNEGTIGPEACADLAADFADTSVRARMGEDSEAAWLRDKFDDWRRAFELAAHDGLVRLH